MHSSSLSPSLQGGTHAGAPAFELKFLVSEPVARSLQEWAQARLAPDPHGDPGAGGSYRTTTLYLDTPAFDVVRRTPGFRRRKYRLRRYGDEPVVFLERKIRSRDRVRKLREAVSEPALALLAARAPPAATPSASSWFQDEVAERRLEPTALLAYVRTAFVGVAADGAVRLTLDRSIRGARARGWEVGAPDGGVALLEDSVVCELKFCTSLPLLFKQLVADFALTPSSVSKYRRLMTLLEPGVGPGLEPLPRKAARDG